MDLQEIVRLAFEQKATDIHLEPRLPVTMRVNGSLKRLQFSLDRGALQEMAHGLLNGPALDRLNERGSCDFSKNISGVHCRINVMHTDRGLGFAIRLLSTNEVTLRSCNLHPTLQDFLKNETGLIILTGPTGSGKTTTLSAMLEEINLTSNRHIITLESPIEYRLAPRKSLIRQREVGVHTPSFEQGLLDSLREDPDVLVVGEMREAEAMRLTLNAAETGHLVLATMHSANCGDAIYRMMMSFPPERQGSVLAQIADSLIAIIAHKMTFRPDVKLLVPVCEVLVANHAVRNVIRKAEVSKILSILQTGGGDGMWTFERYQAWLDGKKDWAYPNPPGTAGTPDGDDPDTSFAVANEVRVVGGDGDGAEGGEPGPAMSLDDDSSGGYSPAESDGSFPPPMRKPKPAPGKKPGRLAAVKKSPGIAAERIQLSENRISSDGRIEIPENDGDLNKLLEELENSD
jgi:twitching motility protein PilT